MMVFASGAVLTVLLVVLLANGISRFMGRKADTSTGLEYIKKAEAAEISAVEKKIAQLETQEAQDNDTRSLKERFMGAVVMGDSIAEGFAVYDVLNASNVVSKIGVHLSEMDEEVEKIKELDPKIVFLSIGMNDIVSADGKTDTFISEYKELIEDLKAAVPGAHIFVNSIFPVSKEAVKEDPSLAHIDEYNVLLEKLCEKVHAGFIDNGSTLDEEYYEQDGIHLKAAYYTIWAEYMAEVAGL